MSWSDQFGLPTGIEYFGRFLSAVIVGVLAWLAMRWKHRLQKDVSERMQKKGEKIDVATVGIVGRLVSIAIFVLAALIILQTLGINVGPLLAFGGIGAAAVGFAAKDVIANFFGGFMLHFTRPFIKGEYVLLVKEGIEGSIEEIGWYLTAIRDQHKRPVYLPNALFSTALIVNISRMSHRHIQEKVQVSYTDLVKMPDFVTAIRKAIAQIAMIDQQLPILVGLQGFGESALVIEMRAYTCSNSFEEYLAARQEVLIVVERTIRELGGELSTMPHVKIFGVQ